MFEGLLVIAVPSGPSAETYIRWCMSSGPAAQIFAIYCQVWGWVGDGQDTN